MKTMIRLEPEGLRPAEAAQFIGLSVDTLDRCRAAGWIKPSVCQRKLVIYRPGSLRALLTRLEREELPGKKLSRGVRGTTPALNETPAQRPV